MKLSNAMSIHQLYHKLLLRECCTFSIDTLIFTTEILKIKNNYRQLQ